MYLTMPSPEATFDAIAVARTRSTPCDMPISARPVIVAATSYDASKDMT